LNPIFAALGNGAVGKRRQWAKCGPMITLPYSPDHDVNDDEPWSEQDIRDLENHVRHGASLEETAEFLCRGGTVQAVAEKAKELGLTFQHSADQPNVKT